MDTGQHWVGSGAPTRLNVRGEAAAVPRGRSDVTFGDSVDLWEVDRLERDVLDRKDRFELPACGWRAEHHLRP